MSGLFKRIDTVFLKVKDFDKAIDWYTTVLGFSVRWVHQDGGYAALNIGETPLTLVKAGEGEELPKKSPISFNFYSPNIEAAHAHLIENNVEVEPINSESDGVKWFRFKDLEGNSLEVCYFKE